MLSVLLLLAISRLQYRCPLKFTKTTLNIMLNDKRTVQVARLEKQKTYTVKHCCVEVEGAYLHTLSYPTFDRTENDD